MILDKLFYQYRSGKKLLWSSKLMNRLGRAFIGTPEELGLGSLREDIRQQFYMDKVNRLLPKDPAAFQEWAKDSDLVNKYRESAEPQVSKGTALLAAMLVMVLVPVGAIVHAAKGDKAAQVNPVAVTSPLGALKNLVPSAGSGKEADISGKEADMSANDKAECDWARKLIQQGLTDRAQVERELGADKTRRCGL